MNRFDLAGRVALVTGRSRGLGKAIGRRKTLQGWHKNPQKIDDGTVRAWTVEVQMRKELDSTGHSGQLSCVKSRPNAGSTIERAHFGVLFAHSHLRFCVRENLLRQNCRLEAQGIRPRRAIGAARDKLVY